MLCIQVITYLLIYWWLSIWSTDEYNQDVWYYIKYYSILCGISILCIAIVEGLWNIGGIFSSLKIHNKTLKQIIKAPISFFDKTPTGRLLNRFSHDISIIDFYITKSINSFSSRITLIIGTIILLCILVPYLLFLFIPLSIIFIFIQKYYSNSSREIRRLDKITKSPIFSFLEETQSGISTLRAYKQENNFIDKMNEFILQNQTIYWNSHQINRWLGVRLEILGAFATSVVSLFGVFLSSSLGSGYVGLMISQAISLSYSLNWTVRTYVDFESQLTSVERLFYLINNTPKENDNYQIIPKESWPHSGSIQFENSCVRYRDDLPFVLNHLSLDIFNHEKIGICGRTGAGKSSLILCLFRIMELNEGKIIIDDIDISKIPLEILREKLSIIPQTPMLFPGTVRNNLDPLNHYSDHDIWNALDNVSMKDYISSLNLKLETEIIEWGENFSTGQRQLLCLARVILKSSKILILDEATASVDPETDQLIQNTIRNVFKNCTIITVAHRLSSIIDNDRVVVLENGKIAEIGPPKDLLKDSSSLFSQMLNAASEN